MASPTKPRPSSLLFPTCLAVLLALYCALDPLRHGPMVDFPGFSVHPVDIPPWSELEMVRDGEDSLVKAERRWEGVVQGPESVAWDREGKGPYAGVADGRVLVWDGREWVYFAHTSPNRSEICDPKPSLMDYLKNEHICGRPLGLRFSKKTGELYIADAYFGLMKVGPEGGLATSLAMEAEGVPFKFTNDLDIDDDGNVYFTDSSSNYQRRNFLQLSFTSEPSGRLLKYDPLTKKAVVLVRDIQFPNGVSLSKDGTFLVYCEGSLGRLTKFWLKGEKAGTSELLVMLPGFPDNIRTNEKGEFWVAIHSRTNIYVHVLSQYTGLRKAIMKLPIPAKIHYFISIGGGFYGMIMKVSADGKVLQVLEDRQGKVVRVVSEVEERDGELWLGSVLMSFIAVYKL